MGLGGFLVGEEKLSPWEKHVRDYAAMWKDDFYSEISVGIGYSANSSRRLLCKSSSNCCGIVCGEFLAVSGCTSNVVSMLKGVVRTNVTGSILRFHVDGVDYFAGFGRLGFLALLSLQDFCVIRRDLGCFEFCLMRCGSWFGDGGVLLSMEDAPDANRIVVCTVCVILRDYVIGDLWSFGEIERRAWSLHVSIREAYGRGEAVFKDYPGPVLCRVLRGVIDNDFSFRGVLWCCRNVVLSLSPILPQGIGWPLLGTRPSGLGQVIGYVLRPNGSLSGFLRVPSDMGHVGIVGATGSGKSNTLKAVAEALMRLNSSVIVFDWEGEHSDIASIVLEPGEVRAHILAEPDPRAVVDILESILTVIGENYQLSPLMSQLLAKVMARTRRRIAHILKELEILAEREHRNDVRNSIYALVRRLWALQPVLELLEPGPNKRLDPAKPQPGFVYVVDLSALPPRQRTLYVQAVASYLLRSRRIGEKPLLYLAVEEAHNMAVKDSPVEQVLLEARKKNIRLIAVSSHPTPLLHNMATLFAHRQPDIRSARVMANMLALTPKAYDELTAVLLSLERGEAIVKVQEAKPVLARICVAPDECRSLGRA